MNFISFPLAYDDRITSQEILRTRREKLGLSQQQVAKAAKLQLRQYQRIESGERNLETATLRTALAICAVLKLDPYAFFPEGEVMNKYIEISSKQSATSDIEETLTTFLQQACELYNDYVERHAMSKKGPKTKKAEKSRENTEKAQFYVGFHAKPGDKLQKGA